MALFALVLCSGCVNPWRPFLISRAAPGVYEGFKPRNETDYQALKTHGIRTILSLEALPWDVYPEKRHAKREGFIYRNTPIPASPIPPNERRVREVLETLRQPDLQPIYLHCFLGRDRNAFILGLYRIYYQGWTPEAAWQDMLGTDFRLRFSLRGLRTYFWRHCNRPQWVARETTPTPTTAHPTGRPP